jgi:hypothetical protein
MAKFHNEERTCQAVKDYKSYEKPPRLLISKKRCKKISQSQQHVIIQQ